uniref:Hydrazine synthase alpha subunit middle domain-containing protein n=1 Tax=Eiseniibacteriota bacterium TaxID=2212470 RepID=A0A832I6F3_UNCEI
MTPHHPPEPPPRACGPRPDPRRPRARAAARAASLGAALAAALGAALAGGSRATRADPAGLPAIVFVSRARPSVPGAVPGLGPGDRALAPGGRLVVREPDGAWRDLLPPGTLHDVSDPSVSPDARRVAFAGVTHPDSGWRLWVVGLDGAGLAPLTRTPPASGAEGAAPRVDDFDPTWVAEHALVFASTRHAQRAQYGDAPVTNLFRLDLDTGALARLTAERNGAEEPWYDAARDRVLFARWWFNRHRAAGAARVAGDAPGLRSLAPGDAAADEVNAWHVMEISPEGGAARLAAGDPAARRAGGGTQPAALADGRVVAVFARSGGLFPRAGTPGVHVFDRVAAPGRRLLGPALDAGEGYGSPAGLAAPGAHAPAPLPGGRLLVAWDPGGRGDYGVWLADPDRGALAPLADRDGTIETDPAPVVAWASRPRSAQRPPTLPARDPRDAAALAALPTFRYQNADVFAGRGPARRDGARLRVYATLARPGAAGGDSAVLLREAPVARDGRVTVDLPAGVPLFEQLAGPDGVALAGPLGPAHVAGSNAGVPGGVSACRGCHAGHSPRAAGARLR